MSLRRGFFGFFSFYDLDELFSSIFKFLCTSFQEFFDNHYLSSFLKTSARSLKEPEACDFISPVFCLSSPVDVKFLISVPYVMLFISLLYVRFLISLLQVPVKFFRILLPGVIVLLGVVSVYSAELTSRIVLPPEVQLSSQFENFANFLLLLLSDVCFIKLRIQK